VRFSKALDFICAPLSISPFALSQMTALTEILTMRSRETSYLLIQKLNVTQMYYIWHALKAFGQGGSALGLVRPMKSVITRAEPVYKGLRKLETQIVRRRSIHTKIFAASTILLNKKARKPQSIWKCFSLYLFTLERSVHFKIGNGKSKIDLSLLTFCTVTQNLRLIVLLS